MHFILIVLTATLLVGVLIGCTLSEQLLQARTRRQAVAQCSLNSQWQELERQWRELETARQEVQEVCLRAGGPLDKVTWDQYAPGASYQDTCAGR
jgi:uncharacterized membrane-anchored protein YhcB (DUF1043 family)